MRLDAGSTIARRPLSVTPQGSCPLARVAVADNTYKTAVAMSDVQRA